MRTHSVVRRMSVLTFVVILSLVGMPRPTTALGEEDVAVTRHRGVTFNGRPLSELVVLSTPQARPPVPPPNRRRVSADQLLGGGTATDSLDALISILPGYEVVVRDEAGRKTRGRLLAISGEGVVVSRRRRFFGLFRSPEELVFGAHSIARVDIVDSTWNGTAIGAAVGAGLMVGLWQAATHTNDFGAGFLYAWFAGAAPVVGTAAGHDIDLAINESVYERPSNRPRVTVAPLLGRDGGGLMAVVSF